MSVSFRGTLGAIWRGYRRRRGKEPGHLDTPAWVNRLEPADLRGLTPLLYRHINPYGLFRLDMTARLALAQRA